MRGANLLHLLQGHRITAKRTETRRDKDTIVESKGERLKLLSLFNVEKGTLPTGEFRYKSSNTSTISGTSITPCSLSAKLTWELGQPIQGRRCSAAGVFFSNESSAGANLFLQRPRISEDQLFRKLNHSSLCFLKSKPEYLARTHVIPSIIVVVIMIIISHQYKRVSQHSPPVSDVSALQTAPACALISCLNLVIRLPNFCNSWVVNLWHWKTLCALSGTRTHDRRMQERVLCSAVQFWAGCDLPKSISCS